MTTDKQIAAPRHIEKMREEFDAQTINGDPRIANLWTEVDRLRALAAAERIDNDEMKNRIVSIEAARDTERDRAERMEGALRSYDNLSLIIENALRETGSSFHGPAVNTIKLGRTALAQDKEKSSG